MSHRHEPPRGAHEPARGREHAEEPGPADPGHHHRRGLVPLGEASVAVVVATPHRAEAFEACRFAIDELKAKAPIWKKEQLAAGGDRWVENKEGRPGQGAP